MYRSDSTLSTAATRLAATVSVRDVAAAAGVSVGTVSNVLNRPGRVAPATVERVHAAIERLGFVRNDAARQLRAGRSRAIGLVVLEASNPFFSALARGAEDRARDAGMMVLLANSGDSDARERAALELFEEQRVAGLIVSPVGDDVSRIERLRARAIEVVLLERSSSPIDVSSVAVDNVAGGRIAIEHLAEVDHRRIAFVGGPLSLHQVSDRLTGAAAASSELGLTLEVVATDELTVAAGRQAAASIASAPAGARTTAVFAANDLLAIGLLQGLGTAGLRVPDDIALVGYDDIEFASSVEVPLTSVRQPSHLLGMTAVELLLERVADPAAVAQHRVFQPELVVRASTTPVT